MLENRRNETRLLQAFESIDDKYLSEAEAFRSTAQAKKNKYRIERKWVAAAAVASVVLGISACGAAYISSQLHITAYDSAEHMAKDKNIKEWDAISMQDDTFIEDGYLNLHSQSMVDILLSADNENSGYTLVNGKSTDKWKRMIWKDNDETSYGSDLYYECYDYDNLSDMFSDYNIAFNMEYIEQNFPNVRGEYGCDFVYKTKEKKDCMQRRFFSGFSDDEGRIVNVEYSEDNVNKNEDPYDLFENSTTTGYLTTKDGVEVFITKAKGTKGGSLVSGEVLTENAGLYVNIYGEFSDKEIEDIFNSLEIAKGMQIGE